MFTLLLSKMLLIEAKKKINVSMLINSRSKLLFCGVFALCTRTCTRDFPPPPSSLTVGICSVISSVLMLLSTL